MGDEKNFKMTTKSGKYVYLQAVTMNDPATGWIDIYRATSALAGLIVNQIKPAWLAPYPLPNKVIEDRERQRLAVIREMITNDYGIKVRPMQY